MCTLHFGERGRGLGGGGEALGRGQAPGAAGHLNVALLGPLPHPLDGALRVQGRVGLALHLELRVGRVHRRQRRRGNH